MFVSGVRQQGEERRRRPRRAVSLPISVWGPGGDLLMRTRTIDISTQGAMLHAYGDLELGARIRVEVARGPDRNPLRLDAQVVRYGSPIGCHHEGVAIRFVELGSLDETILRSLMAELHPLEG